jgi:F-type H+-transporting ATPase subunit epsilon
MVATIEVELISPARVIDRVEAASVTLPSTLGYLTILPGHAPLISDIGVGILTVRHDTRRTTEYFVSGGYLEADNHRLKILAEVVESPQEIDRERAKKARERALARVKDFGSDVARAQASLERADTRIALVATHEPADHR